MGPENIDPEPSKKATGAYIHTSVALFGGCKSGFIGISRKFLNRIAVGSVAPVILDSIFSAVSVLTIFTVPYSVLRATTGSFLAALRDGMMPAISVKSTLITTSTAAVTGGRAALRLPMPVSLWRMRFIGMQRR